LGRGEIKRGDGKIKTFLPSPSLILPLPKGGGGIESILPISSSSKKGRNWEHPSYILSFLWKERITPTQFLKEGEELRTSYLYPPFPRVKGRIIPLFNPPPL